MTADSRWRPATIRPGTGGIPGAAGLLELLADAAALDELLLRQKALVFRSFGIAPDELDGVLDRMLPHRLAYVHGNSPRTKVGDNVYTSTDYPAELTISMHNELSYSHRWPARLCFYCERAPGGGGATPVVDGQRWLDSLDDRVRSAFAGGVRYVQNLPDGYGLGRSWQDTFETADRDAVAEFMAGTGAQWEWRPDGSLQVCAVRPATIRHPRTGAEVWFNQTDQWHPAGLDDGTAAALAAVLGEDELPQRVTFADGSPIPDEHVRQVRDRGLAAAVDVDWAAGDLLLLDNVLVAHGRRPFTGDRRVLVSMSD